ncbi:MAG: CRISPR-associated endonuclease Cas1 [Candidatus Acidiferrales bacterium]
MAASATVSQLPQSRNLLTSRLGTITLYGYGITVCVDRGHLVLKDAIGEDRREIRIPRVRHGLRRIVVIGSDGIVSLAALRWLADQDAAFVMLDRDGSVLATTGPVCSSDARLRRAQALATQSGTDLRITRALISAKLLGQERIASENLHNARAAEDISEARNALDSAETIPSIRGLEAQAGHAYWQAWKSLPVNFPKVDARKVPEHWKVFGTRISPISGSPRCAINPPNSILNYAYSILEAESRLALVTVGLDPGLGFLHVDSRTRDSLACDLMEPVRPEVDSYVLDWLTHHLFQRKDFFEMADGTCRLMAGLCVQLSQTAKAWATAVAPWAELIARTLWATVGKPGKQPATPLTGDHRRAGRAGEHVRPAVFPPKPSRVCKICGVSCEKTYCASCGAAHSLKEFDKGRLAAQTPESRAQRSTTQKAHVLAIRAWKPSKELDWLDRKTYINKIQPHLASITISALQSALEISEPYAAFIRSGSRVPHQRHWLTLAQLVGIRQA